jgi:hypothetical protein
VYWQWYECLQYSGHKTYIYSVIIYFQKCMYVFIMCILSTVMRDSLFSANDGGISAIQADSNSQAIAVLAKTLINIIIAS